MSKARLGNNYNLGYKHTPEARANMTASRLGKKRGSYKSVKSRVLAERNAKRKGKS